MVAILVTAGIECLDQCGAPEGLSGAFVLPLAVLYFIFLCTVCYPLVFALGNLVGVALSIAVVAVGVMAMLTALVYRHGVDSSLLDVCVAVAIFLGIPLVLGAIAGFRVMACKGAADA